MNHFYYSAIRLIAYIRGDELFLKGELLFFTCIFNPLNIKLAMSTNELNGNQPEVMNGHQLHSPDWYDELGTQVDNTDGNRLDIIDGSQGSTSEQNEAHFERFVLPNHKRIFFFEAAI